MFIDTVVLFVQFLTTINFLSDSGNSGAVILSDNFTGSRSLVYRYTSMVYIALTLLLRHLLLGSHYMYVMSFNNCNPDTTEINIDVPQGSILRSWVIKLN